LESLRLLRFNPTGVLAIWGPDNQQYGFFIRQELWDFVVARMVDENTLAGSLPASWRRKSSKIDLTSNPVIQHIKGYELSKFL